MPGCETRRRVRMADADEPWIREWINSVADDMMREHCYMEVSLRGSELVSVSLPKLAQPVRACWTRTQKHHWEVTKNLAADNRNDRPPRFGFLQDAILCFKFLSEELLSFGNLAVPFAELVRS